jgi:hypothetical protein
MPLPLPESGVTLNDQPDMGTAVEDEEAAVPFTSDLQIRHGHGNAALGSRVDFSSTSGGGGEMRSEQVRGRVFVRVGWGRNDDGVVLAPPKEQWKPPKSSVKTLTSFAFR